MTEFKEEDDEPMRYIEVYLQKPAFDIRTKRNVSAADYRAFALDFSEKSNHLVRRGVISEYKRGFFFLQAFSDKVGDRLCKKNNIDMDEPETTLNVFAVLKRDALNLCCDNNLQTKMRILF